MSDQPRAGKRLVRYRNKTYLRLPHGELQFGHISRSLVLWWRGRRHIVRSGAVGRVGRLGAVRPSRGQPAKAEPVAVSRRAVS